MENLTVRQKQIIEAALDIIVHQGIQQLTIKNLAEKVGFRDAAVYRHFKSKYDILFTIADLFEKSSRSVLETIGRSSCSNLEKIKLFFLDRCQIFAADKIATTVMFSDDLFKKESELAAKILAIIETHQKLLEKILRAGQASGEIKPLPAPHLFMTIMGSLRLLVTRWQASGCRFDLAAEGQKLWNSLASLISLKAGKV